MTTTALDKRKAFILQTVVYEYINTAEPVGSMTLTQKYNLGVSSATIRNEMAELEASGYLVQPHTSSGRVPSDAGYRTYVDELMSPETLRPEETQRIREEFRAASRDLDGVIEQTTRLLGAALAQPCFRDRAGALDADVPSHSIDLVLGTHGSGGRRDVARNADANAFRAEIGRERRQSYASFEFIECALGRPFARGDCRASKSQPPSRSLGSARTWPMRFSMRFRKRADPSDPLIAASGAQNLLDQPEFHDLRKLRSILRIVEEQKRLYELLAEGVTQEGAHVRIGHELGTDEISECSLVTVPYRIGEHAVGLLAILGPRRMPYGRLMALAGSTADSLGAHLLDVELR